MRTSDDEIKNIMHDLVNLVKWEEDKTDPYVEMIHGFIDAEAWSQVRAYTDAELEDRDAERYPTEHLKE